MSDNRLWLRHKETGLSVRLGTYYGHRWTDGKSGNVSDSLTELFETIEEMIVGGILDIQESDAFEVIDEGMDGWKYGDPHGVNLRVITRDL